MQAIQEGIIMRHKIFIAILFNLLISANAIAYDKREFSIDIFAPDKLVSHVKKDENSKDFSLTEMLNDTTTNNKKGITMLGASTNAKWYDANYLVELSFTGKFKKLSNAKFILSSTQDVQEDVFEDYKDKTSNEHLVQMMGDFNGKIGYNLSTSGKVKLEPMVGVGYRKEIIAFNYTYTDGTTKDSVAALNYNTFYFSGGAYLGINFGKNISLSIAGQANYPLSSTTTTFGILKDDAIPGFKVDEKTIKQKNGSLKITEASYKLSGSITKHFAEGPYGLNSISLKIYVDDFKLDNSKKAGTIIAPAFSSTSKGLAITLNF